MAYLYVNILYNKFSLPFYLKEGHSITEMQTLKSQQQTRLQSELLPESFWHSIDILLSKPHVVNKRLWGCKLWKRFNSTPCNREKWSFPTEIARLDCVLNDENLINCTDMVLCALHLEQSDETNSSIEVILLELFPKSVSKTQVVQLILIDRNKLEVYFYDISQENNHKLCPDFPFSIQVFENQIILNAYCEINNKSYEWLTNTLLPHIVKWSMETTNNTYKNNSICKESLSLIQQDNYYKKYNELKNKYGKEMVKIWPECTDPSKFVYEDVAIATYLLLLWEEYGLAQKQTFVDLGCGNGLLVYILTKEGHTGIGYDVRKRNIWDMYTDVQLEEKTIMPSDTSLFPKTDWIIGNHSDELTPWIPVIAAKSSYRCNFFLLPCCAYNFDGTKYQRKNSNMSQYMDYLEHIKELCEQCGFNVGVDRLKIPSTKRICLVSRGRTYNIDMYNDYCDIINNIISQDTESKENWVNNFKPRDPVEKVRNCTQIDKNLINDIVNCIVNYLLDNIDINSCWSGGRTIEIGELIPLISKEQLKQLKAECGGLQTLLKNNHNIFEVHSGKVKIRYPKTIEEVNKRNTKNYKLRVKLKPCWFFQHHPQGCPLTDEQCSFKHKT